jgi:hypothetical protein
MAQEERAMRDRFCVIPYKRNLKLPDLKGDDPRWHEFIRDTAKWSVEDARQYLVLEDDDLCEGYLFFVPGEVPADHPFLVATYEWDCRHPWKVEGGRAHVERVISGLHIDGLLTAWTLARLQTILAEPTRQ